MGPSTSLLKRQEDKDLHEESFNWERSRMLAETVKEQLARGEKVVLPPLSCLDKSA